MGAATASSFVAASIKTRTYFIMNRREFLTASAGALALPVFGRAAVSAPVTAALLKGKTWAIPDPIGATTPTAITGTTVAANTSATIGGGTAITKVISATATLDFSNTSASTCSDMTLTVTDAAAGDSVFLGAPSASVPVGGSFFAWVSAANTVTVRFCADGTARDPASGSFRATIVKF